MCWLRFVGVSGFFTLTGALGLLADPSWHGDLGLFAAYWVIAAALFWHSTHAARQDRLVGFDIALVHMPLVFLLLHALFIGGPNDRGTAGFSVGFYVILVAISALALDVRAIVLTAAVGAGLELGLQTAAHISLGARFATVILLGLTALTCPQDPEVTSRQSCPMIATLSNIAPSCCSAGSDGLNGTTGIWS